METLEEVDECTHSLTLTHTIDNRQAVVGGDARRVCSVWWDLIELLGGIS